MVDFKFLGIKDCSISSWCLRIIAIISINIYHMPGSILSSLCVLIPTLRCKCYYHPHFTDEETEDQKVKSFNSGHPVSKWQSQY